MRTVIFAGALAILFLINLCALASSVNQCDYKVEIIADGAEFESRDFSWKAKVTKMEGEPSSIQGSASITKDGKEIKKYKLWNGDVVPRHRTSSSYSPNLDAGEYTITAYINADCDDKNMEDNRATKKVSITDEKKEVVPKSSKQQEKPVESGKKKIKKSLNPANAEIQSAEIKPQAKKAAPNLTKRNDAATKSAAMAKSPQIPAISNAPSAIPTGAVVFESSGEKSRNWVLGSLLAVSIILNVVLIWKR